MIRLKSYGTALLVGFLLALGCEEPFTPKGPFREEPVIYSILSNLSDTHYARLYRTYDPPAYDPFGHTEDNGITGAAVQLSDGTTHWVFRDTLVARADTGRYHSPINAYVISPLRTTRGKSYTLSVQPPGLPALTATTLLPELGYVSVFRNQGAITGQGSTDHFIGVRVTVPTTTKGYLIRFHVTFDALQNAVWVPHKIEIPYFINSPGLPEETYQYYELQRSVDGPGSTGTVTTHIVDFHADSYFLVISRLYRQYGSGSVRFKQAIFTLTQVEQQLYSYYNISRGFRDPNSIRVDEPDYTNIAGGGGVFGAFAVDSLVIALPTTL